MSLTLFNGQPNIIIIIIIIIIIMVLLVFLSAFSHFMVKFTLWKLGKAKEAKVFL